MNQPKDIRVVDIDSFGSVVYPRGATLGPRARDRFEMVWVQSGSFSVRIADHLRRVDGPEILLLKPLQTNHFAFDKHSPTRHGYLTFSIPDPAGHRLASAFPTIIPGARAGLFLPLFSTLVENLPPFEQCGRENLSRLQRTVTFFLNNWQWPALGTRDPETTHRPPLDRALRYIDERWRNGSAPPISVAGVASAASVTARHLHRLFYQAFDLSPRDYLRERRLEHAAQLLRRSDLTVQAVSRAAGFASEFAFSRAFRSLYGMPPTDYRSKDR